MSTLAFASCFAVWTIFSIIGIGCFMLLFLVVAGNLLWMHAAVLRMERAAATDRPLEQSFEVRVTT